MLDGAATRLRSECVLGARRVVLDKLRVGLRLRVWGVERVESDGEEFGALALVSSVARDARSPGRANWPGHRGPELDQLASDVSLRASDSRGPIAEAADSTRFRPLRLAA